LIMLREPLLQFLALGAVLFVDASDVRLGRAEYSFATPHLAPGVGLRYPTPIGPVRLGRAEYSFATPHLAPGVGLRYPTPIGPVRLDLGLRVLELIGYEKPEGSSPTLFGAPMTLQLAVGQAF